MPDSTTSERHLRRCALHAPLSALFRFKRLRRYSVRTLKRLEGGEYRSATLRDILRERYGVDVGAYSYGGCMVPGAYPRGVSVGRYASIAMSSKVFLRNHPMDRLSMHPFFFNSLLGYVEKDTVDIGTLTIGHDTWLGESAFIMPGCSRIGIGAVVAAGAVVTKDVPDFAIVGGVPAKVLSYRFPEAARQAILESQWWERSIDECLPFMAAMNLPLLDNLETHPLLGNEKGIRA